MVFQKNRNVIFILIVFFVTEIIINPIGEFCLNDDWAYAANVNTLLLENKFELGNWPAMTLIVHGLWGLLFVKIFGFSFTVLRFSVICLSLITVICSERFVFKLTNNRKASLMAAFLFLFNPLFLCLSNSYMTDVSFLCFVLLSIYSFYLFFEKGHMIYVSLAFVFALVCIFIRQIGIVIPLSFLLVAILQWSVSHFWKRVVVLSFIFTGFIFLLLYFFEKYVLKTLTGEYGFQTLFHTNRNLNFSIMTILEHLYVRLGLMFLYSGMFFFPVLISNTREIIQGVKKATVFSKIIISILLLLILFVFHYFPCGNYLYNFGIGIETTYDVMSLISNPERVNINGIFVLILLFSVIGNVLLVSVIFSFNLPSQYYLKKVIDKPFLIFLFLILGLYLVLLSLPLSFFDRYTLVFFSVCVIIVVYRFPKFIATDAFSVSMLILYALFSTIGVVDYFKFNKVKTELVTDLISEKKIPTQEVNGGFEFNMYNSDARDPAARYWDDRRNYMISFTNIKGYSKLYYKTYIRYMPFKEDTLFVLKRNAD